jgi:hypothetical protein
MSGKGAMSAVRATSEVQTEAPRLLLRGLDQRARKDRIRDLLAHPLPLGEVP